MVNKEEQSFLNLIKEVLETGLEEKNDRTGVGTKFLVGKQLRFNLENNTIPIFQTREIYQKNIIWEMIWILRGETNVKFLQDRNVNIWNSWADKNGNLGNVYGYQLRHWNFSYKNDETNLVEIRELDQLQTLVDNIKNCPSSRRNIFTLWNSAEVNKMALPSCHANHFQVFVNNDGLYGVCTCRSTDLILGAPVNIAEWSFFMHLLASVTGKKAKEIVFNFNNPHIYLNHLENAKIWAERKPELEFPTISFKKEVNTIQDMENLTLNDIEIKNYNPQKPNLKFPVAV